MTTRHFTVVIWTAAFLFLGLQQNSFAEEAYKLGAQDQIKVKVSDLRAGTGEAYQWDAFEGEFTVAPNGYVSFPIVGEIEAAGRTTAEVETALATKLQAKAGLAAKPDAALQIIKFRPFYVMGAVEKPADYEYRPGLTVLQAVSIAGGFQRVTPETLRIYLRDAVMSRGDLRELAIGRVGLLAQQARLDAEIKESTNVVFPDEVLARSGEAGVSRMMREETLFFESRKNGLQAQISTLTQNRQYLLSEVESLNAKSANIGRQLDLYKQELERVSGLVKQGLTPLPRQLEVSQTNAQLESNQLDTRLAMIKAREDIARTDRDILELKTTRRNDALREASEIRAKIAESLEKSRTAQSMLEQAETRAPMIAQAIAAEGDKMDYSILRRSNGQSQTITAHEDDIVMPGDVIRVSPKLPKQATSASPVAMQAKRYSSTASEE